MVPDYTIDQARRDGFELGLIFTVRNCDDIDLQVLAIKLSNECPWRSAKEWYRFMQYECFDG